MKIHWYDRVILTLFTLVSIALAGCLIMVAWMPVRVYGLWVDKEIAGQTGQLVITIISVFLFICALRFMFFGVKRGAHTAQPTGVLLRASENGVIRISVAALDALVQKSVKKHTMVRDVESRVIVSDSGEAITVALRVTLMPDAKAPEVGELLQSDVKAYIQETAGINVEEIRVYVEAPPVPSARVE